MLNIFFININVIIKNIDKSIIKYTLSFFVFLYSLKCTDILWAICIYAPISIYIILSLNKPISMIIKLNKSNILNLSLLKKFLMFPPIFIVMYNNC